MASLPIPSYSPPLLLRPPSPPPPLPAFSPSLSAVPTPFPRPIRRIKRVPPPALPVVVETPDDVSPEKEGEEEDLDAVLDLYSARTPSPTAASIASSAPLVLPANVVAPTTTTATAMKHARAPSAQPFTGLVRCLVEGERVLAEIPVAPPPSHTVAEQTKEKRRASKAEKLKLKRAKEAKRREERERELREVDGKIGEAMAGWGF
ncbi:hypothetical protein JCM8097_007594 [Rhodosporidiobolus ruineniae]